MGFRKKTLTSGKRGNHRLGRFIMKLATLGSFRRGNPDIVSCDSRLGLCWTLFSHPMPLQICQECSSLSLLTPPCFSSKHKYLLRLKRGGLHGISVAITLRLITIVIGYIDWCTEL